MLNFQTARWFGDRFRLEHADLVDAAARVFLANDPDCYAATCEMLGEADLRPDWLGFPHAVAVVVGEEDYATPHCCCPRVARGHQRIYAHHSERAPPHSHRMPRSDRRHHQRTLVNPAPSSVAATSSELIARLERMPFSRWHRKARIVMGSATFFDAYNALSLAFALPVLIRPWHITPAQIGVLLGASYVGQLAGALLFGGSPKNTGACTVQRARWPSCR